MRFLILMLVLLAMGLPATLPAQRQSEYSEIEGGNRTPGVFRTSESARQIDAALFIVAAGERSSFLRLQLANRSPKTHSGSCVIQVRQSLYGGFGGPSETEDPAKVVRDFVLAPNAQVTIEVGVLRDRVYGMSLKCEVVFDGSLDVWVPFQRHFEEDSQAFVDYFPAPLLTAHGFNAGGDLRALPKDASTLGLWQGFNVILDETMASADFQALHGYLRAGGNVIFSYTGKESNAADAIEALLGTPLSKSQLAADRATFSKAMQTAAGQLPATYPSGFEAPVERFAAMQERGAADQGRVFSGQEWITDTHERAKSFFNGLEQAALYEVGRGVLVVRLTQDLRITGTVTATFSEDRRISTNWFSAGSVSDEAQPSLTLPHEGDALSANLAAAAAMPVALLALLTILATAALCLAPLLYFKRQRAVWLVPGVVAIALVLVTLSSITSGVYASQATDHVTFTLSLADREGAIVGRVVRENFLGGGSAGIVRAPTGATLLFDTNSADAASPAGTIVAEEESLAIDLESIPSGRNCVLTFLQQSYQSAARYALQRNGESVTNVGNKLVRCGVFFIKDSTRGGLSRTALVGPLEPGESAKVRFLAGRYELDYELQSEGLGHFQEECLSKLFLTELERLQLGREALLLVDPEGEPLVSEEDQADERIHVVLAPIS